MAEALPTILGQQHGFAEVEHVRTRDPACGERLDERGRLVRERNAGRRTDDARAVEGEHEQALGRRRVGGEVLRLVVEVALVEIRPVAEHGDAQRGDRIEVAGGFRAAQRMDFDHELEPRQSGRERDRDEQQGEQEQPGTERAEAADEAAADEMAEDAAASGRQHGRAAALQEREAGRGDEERDEADQAQGRLERRALFARRAAQHDPADHEQQQRERVRDESDQVEHEVGDPRAERAAEIVDPTRGVARVRPARIVLAVAREACEQVDRDRQQQQEAGLAQALVPVLVESRGRFCGFGCARHQENLPEVAITGHCFKWKIQ